MNKPDRDTYAVSELKREQALVRLQRRLSIIVLSMVAFAFVFAVGTYFAEVIKIFCISVLVSYLLIGLVDFIERFVRSRMVSIILVYLLFAAVMVVGCVVVIPATAYQFTQLIENTFNELPELVSNLETSLKPLEARLHAAHLNIGSREILSHVVASIPHPEPYVVLDRVSNVALSTMAIVVYGISVFVMSFYFLLDGHRMTNAIIRLFPERYAGALQSMAKDMDKSLQSFFKGQIALAFVAGVVMLEVYVLLGVPYALLLAIVLAFWEIVPVIGPPLGFIPAAVVVLFHGMDKVPGNHFVGALILTVIFAVMQQVKDNVVAPKYIGNVIGVHPIVIFIAILIGARLDGLFGVIISIPVACIINVLWHHWPLICASVEDELVPVEAVNVSVEIVEQKSDDAP